MSFTPDQARDDRILASVAQFLSRTVKAAYDTAVQVYTTPEQDISKPLKIMQGKPSDASLALDPPSIGIEDMNAGRAVDFEEVGSQLGNRYMNLVLYCYPAVNAKDGEPSDRAAGILKGLIRNALATYSFKAVDYGNPACTPTNILYCGETIVIDKAGSPMNRAKSSPNALERNRFDVDLRICYSVMEALVS
jgi:hypothetical protein